MLHRIVVVAEGLGAGVCCAARGLGATSIAVGILGPARRADAAGSEAWRSEEAADFSIRLTINPLSFFLVFFSSLSFALFGFCGLISWLESVPLLRPREKEKKRTDSAIDVQKEKRFFERRKSEKAK